MEKNKKGFFSKVKKWFKGEEKLVEEQPIQEIIQEEKPIIKFEECFYCREPIYEGEHYSKQQGRMFHRPCYKMFLQAGRRGKL